MSRPLSLFLPIPTHAFGAPLQSARIVNLGPHPPRLWPEDIELVHRLWLELTGKGPGAKLRHRDVVGVALRRLDQSR